MVASVKPLLPQMDDRIASLLRQVQWFDQELAERDLYDFVRLLWSTIESDTYTDGWHIRLICQKLQAVTEGRCRRLLILIPPRHAKSLLTSVFWPAWTWIHQPQFRFMTSSYAHGLAVEHSRKCRDLIRSEQYQSLWGDRFALAADQDTKTMFATDKHGYRRATSVTGALTGFGADAFIIDDAHNVVEAESEPIRQSTITWFREALPSRINSKMGSLVVIQQRVHENDLAGWILANQRDRWDVVCLPARYEPDHPQVSPDDIRTKPGELLWPDRFPEDELEDKESTLGPYAFAGQYQQRPAPKEGGLFPPGCWEYMDTRPTYPRIIVRGWDLGATEDGKPTVGVQMSWAPGKPFVVEHVLRLFASPHRAEQAIETTTKNDGRQTVVDLPQDPGQAGKAQVQYLKRKLVGFRVLSSREVGNKTSPEEDNRAWAYATQAEAHNVCLVRAEWNQSFIDEHQMYPMGTYNDQVDGANRAFMRLILLRKRRRSGGISGAPQVV